MLDATRFSKSKPVVKPENLNGANVAVATIAHVEEIELGGEPKLVMQFEEFPYTKRDGSDDLMNYFPNLTSIRNLIDGLGEDESTWTGKSVVLEVVKTNDPAKRRPVAALWVANADSWDDHFARAEKRSAKAAAVEVPAAHPDSKRSSSAKKASGKRR